MWSVNTEYEYTYKADKIKAAFHSLSRWQCVQDPALNKAARQSVQDPNKARHNNKGPFLAGSVILLHA